MSTLLIVAAGSVVLAVAMAALLVRGGKPSSNFGSFSSRPLLNKSEGKLLLVLDQAAGEAFGPQARVFAQVSYGEFLKGGDRSAHARINQKRADFVVVDENNAVLCVVEYQGRGHYGRGELGRANAEKRDRVKRAACASAGIALVEIAARFTPESVRQELTTVATARFTPTDTLRARMPAE